MVESVVLMDSNRVLNITKVFDHHGLLFFKFNGLNIVVWPIKIISLNRGFLQADVLASPYYSFCHSRSK